MPYLKVNGANLHYEDQGSGPETIVFSHSLLFNCHMFDDQVRAFKNQYRCITFDFRGQGRSEVTLNGYDMESLAKDAASVIEQLDCAPCHFLGFSMGGFVALRLAIQKPELLRSIILVDTSADPEQRGDLFKFRLLNIVARWIGPWAVSRQVMPILFSKNFLNDPQKKEIRETWRKYFVENHRIGVTRAVTGVITRPGVRDLLPNISLPTLIMVGEEDIATVPEKSKQMHESIPGSQFVTIPKAGHMTPVEKPEAVNSAIRNFLGTLD